MLETTRAAISAWAPEVVVVAELVTVLAPSDPVQSVSVDLDGRVQPARPRVPPGPARAPLGSPRQLSRLAEVASGLLRLHRPNSYLCVEMGEEIGLPCVLVCGVIPRYRGTHWYTRHSPPRRYGTR